MKNKLINEKRSSGSDNSVKFIKFVVLSVCDLSNVSVFALESYFSLDFYDLPSEGNIRSEQTLQIFYFFCSFCPFRLLRIIEICSVGVSTRQTTEIVVKNNTNNEN